MDTPVLEASWSPTSWQDKPARQMPTYDDPVQLERVLVELARLPPIVVSWEVEQLKQQLADAQRGERFLLQGGDCAESFDDCDSGQIARKLKILLQMSLVLLHGLKKPVIRVGRFAGQYAKPRSADTETRGERDPAELPRRPGQPAGVHARGARRRSAADAARLRARGADAQLRARADRRRLRRPASSRVLGPRLRAALAAARCLRAHRCLDRRLARLLRGALRRPDSRGLPGATSSRATKALLLPYEQAQTRYVPRQSRWYNLSTHLPWIGVRTAQLDGAHVEYFRGISNPIGVKVGPGMDADWIRGLVDVLHPHDEPGRLTFIHRFGASQVEEGLPRLVEAVRATGRSVLWVCDPMHGNTEIDGDRRQDAALREHPRASSRRPSTSTRRWARCWAACTSN